MPNGGRLRIIDPHRSLTASFELQRGLRPMTRTIQCPPLNRPRQTQRSHDQVAQKFHATLLEAISGDDQNITIH